MDKSWNLAYSGRLSWEQAELIIHLHTSPGHQGVDEGCCLAAGRSCSGNRRLSLMLAVSCFPGTIVSCLSPQPYVQGLITAACNELLLWCHFKRTLLSFPRLGFIFLTGMPGLHTPGPVSKAIELGYSVSFFWGKCLCKLQSFLPL